MFCGHYKDIVPVTVLSMCIIIPVLFKWFLWEHHPLVWRHIYDLTGHLTCIQWNISHLRNFKLVSCDDLKGYESTQSVCFFSTSLSAVHSPIWPCSCFASSDSMWSVSFQVWRSWMTRRSWRRREPRLGKPTGYSRAVTAAENGERTHPRSTLAFRKSPAASWNKACVARVNVIIVRSLSACINIHLKLWFVVMYGHVCLLGFIWKTINN